MFEAERLRRALALVGDDRLEVSIRHIAFAIGEALEAHEGTLQLVAVQTVAQLFEPVTQGVTPAQLAEHEGRAGANLPRFHDLERPPVLEHPVLVDAGVMREGIGPDHRLVGLYEHARELRDEARRAIELGVVELGCHAIHLRMQAGGHGHLLEGRIAGSLADTVDTRLDLARATEHADQ